MTTGEIQDTVTSIFRKVFEDNSIVAHDAMTAKDVDKWDSLTHLTMISEVEKSFGIKFKLKELVSMKNVGDMFRLIENKTNA